MKQSQLPVKFRCWHKHQEKMFMVEEIRPGVGGSIIAIEKREGVMDHRLFGSAEMRLLRVMQHTGLQITHEDQRHEVFELDVLQHDGNKGFVIYSNGSFWVELTEAKAPMEVSYRILLGDFLRAEPVYLGFDPTLLRRWDV